MKDYRNTYESLLGRLPEAMDKGVFISDARPAIIKDDILFCTGLSTILEINKVPVESTYFIVDIGHAHLVGVGLELMRKGIDVSYFIPIKPNERMSQALAYHANRNTNIKASIGLPIGFATMIDTHRNNYDHMAYNLTSEALPSAGTLVDLGIERMVYLNEGLLKKNTDYKSRTLDKDRYPEFKKLFTEYEQAGIELQIHGIDARKPRGMMNSPLFGIDPRIGTQKLIQP